MRFEVFNNFAEECHPIINIPSAITNLAHLEILRLRISELNGTIPSDIGRLTSLQHLSISKYPYVSQSSKFATVIPSSFWKLRKLRSLEFMWEELRNFQSWTTSDPFPDLELLSFRYSPNFVGNVDPILRSSKKLQIIDFKASSPEADMQALDGMISLSSLDISDSGISWEIRPSFWSSHPQLEFFTASNARMVTGTIGDGVGSMTRLSALELGNTRMLGSIPASIGSTALTTLILASTFISGPIPDSITQLNRTLRLLDLSHVNIGSTIPESIGALRRLSRLDLANCGLIGSIPSSFGHISRLDAALLSDNALEGSLPEFIGSPSSLYFDASHNHLSGTLPASLATRATVLNLGYNELGPSLDENIFNKSSITYLTLSNNRFFGPLPAFNVGQQLKLIDMSFNNFSGTIPMAYNQAAVLKLSHNNLVGSLSKAFVQGSVWSYLDISHNQIGDVFPSFLESQAISKVDISNNRFHGALPHLPTGTTYFYASKNRFTATDLSEWATHVRSSRLQLLDLSGNWIETDSSFYILIGPELKYLSINDNSFTNDDSIVERHQAFGLIGLEAARATLDGTFSSHFFPHLTTLKLSGNMFHGPLKLDDMQYLIEVDVSYNYFEGDVAIVGNLPLLNSINIRNNSFHGLLSLGTTLPNLQSADFSGNNLDYPPNLVSIGNLFVNEQLQLLNISNNPRIPHISSFNTQVTGLNRSLVSSPSSLYRDTVTCYELIFWNKTGIQFVFDDELFDYRQCDCNGDHFGLPPHQCFSCPSSPVSSCGGSEVVVSEHHYSYVLPSSSQLETESCLVTTIQILSSSSNCLGLNISDKDILLQSSHSTSPNTPSYSTPSSSSSTSTSDHVSNTSQTHLPLSLLQHQCRNGSEGRLCSKCVCDVHGEGECWFESGATCSKCRHVLKLVPSMMLLFGCVVIAIVVLSPLMTIILRRKRVQSVKKYNDLPLWKRIFYRLMYLTTLGNLSIVITFLQMLVAFTQWDVYARLEVLGAINGNAAKMGLECAFPFLSEPIWGLVGNFAVPFVVIGVVYASIGIGNMLAMLLDKKKLGRSLDENEDMVVHERTPIVVGKEFEVAVEYPTSALLSSFGISILKFFYFGTALSSHQYIFSSRQALSGIVYVQHKPWMKYSDALSLIVTSIPMIMIFDVLIPLAFLVVCWKVRKSLSSWSVQIYCGPLFGSYTQKCFWWEIVNTLRKLSVALLLKAIPPSDASQSALIISVLIIVLLAQVTLNPWRRKIENFSDTTSTAILILALLYSRPTHLTHTNNILWYIFAISVGYVVFSVVVLAWQTLNGKTDYEKLFEAHIGGDYRLNTQVGFEERIEQSNLDEWSMSSSENENDYSP